MPTNPDFAKGSPRTWARMLGALDDVVALHTLAVRQRRAGFNGHSVRGAPRRHRRAS